MPRLRALRSISARDARIVRKLHAAASRSRGSRFLVVCVGTCLPYLAVAGYAAYLFGSEPPRFAAAAFIEAAAAGGAARFLVGSPLRYLFPRPRPHKTHGLSSLIRQESLSLPSGHALFFFAFAVSAWFVAPVAGAALFVAAVLIGIARVAAGIHYPSDIILGATIGAIVALALHALI